ncbi:MAG: hypothetical protein IKB93_15270 [Clostridia bacterium]|nr:hypothetical protein [Clostridia bacterium]
MVLSEQNKIILEKICSYGAVACFVIAVICLILAVVFFFLFRIPDVIGDLSGRNAKRSIAQLRAINEKSGSKSYRTSETNSKRGKLTGTMEDSGKLKKKSKKSGEPKKKILSDDDRPETGLLESNVADKSDVQQTELLDTNDETGLLGDPNETETLELVSNKAVPRVGGKKMEILEEIILIHTDEIIEL